MTIQLFRCRLLLPWLNGIHSSSTDSNSLGVCQCDHGLLMPFLTNPFVHGTMVGCGVEECHGILTWGGGPLCHITYVLTFWRWVGLLDDCSVPIDLGGGLM